MQIKTEASQAPAGGEEPLASLCVPDRPNVNHNLLAKVEARENDVLAGKTYLRECQAALRKHQAGIPSAAKWIEQIESLEKVQRECKVLVGFLGTTGAGKSSMINALLEHKDLLPADDEKTCTAVCVEIGWNPDENPEAAYQATIERISADDLDKELHNLFKDVSGRLLNKDGEDGEVDFDRDLRITTAFSKLKAVFPHIKSVDDLKGYSIRGLLASPAVKDIVGVTKYVKESSKADFAAAIKSYIDSSSTKDISGRDFSQWPLVKKVSLAIKSDTLKEGIVLVDLPGNMDTNTARGAIAEAYQKKLTVTCVVSRVSRASSDRPAQEMLGKVIRNRRSSWTASSPLTNYVSSCP